MNVMIILSACAGLSFAADAPKDDAVKKELEKFQGTWVVESAKVKGEEFEDMKGKKIAFDGDRFTLVGKADKKTTVKLDPSKNPRQFDLIDPEFANKKREPIPGIYEIEGDSLKLAVAEASGTTKTDGTGKIIEETFMVGKRPTSFDGKEGIVFVLKREKK